MARGIIYMMTSVVPGLIKIGKTGKENFESRMYNLERNGYSNVTGLKRAFAIEVDDFDEKERLLDDIFDKSRVPNTELFALDPDLVIQLLSSFEGKQIYPASQSKEEIFEKATLDRQNNAEEVAESSDFVVIPNGTYYLEENRRGFGKVTAKMNVQDGIFTVLKGSICVPVKGEWAPKSRREANIENNVLMEDIDCKSPSTAGFIVRGSATNGWTAWKDRNGKPIDEYRKNK